METKRRVLLLGDSIAFSRSNHAQIFSDAWPVKVKEALPDYDIWQRCRPAATILEVKNEFGLFKSHIAEFSPVIIQVGIIDACPRPFPYLFQRLLSMFASPEVLRWIGSRYHRLLKFRSRPGISEQEFQSILKGSTTTMFQFYPFYKYFHLL